MKAGLYVVIHDLAFIRASVIKVDWHWRFTYLHSCRTVVFEEYAKWPT